MCRDESQGAEAIVAVSLGDVKGCWVYVVKT